MAEGSDDETEYFVIKVDGQTKEVTFDDLISNYQKGENYTRKMQEMSQKIKEEVEKQVSERTQSLNKEREHLISQLDMVEGIFQPKVSQEDLDKLIAEGDYDEYNRVKYENEKLSQTCEALQKEKDAQKAKMAEEQNKRMQEYAAAEAEILFNNIPELKDQDKLSKLAKYLENTSFSKDEISNAYDSRALTLAYKAMQHDELKTSVQNKKVKKLRRS